MRYQPPLPEGLSTSGQLSLIFTNVQSEPPLVRLCHSHTWCPWFPGAEAASPSAFCLRELQRPRSSPLSFFSRSDNPSAASLSLNNSSFLAVLLALLFSGTLTSSAYDRAQNCTQYSRLGYNNAKYSKRITPFDRLTVLCLMHPNYSLPSWLPGHAAGS